VVTAGELLARAKLTSWPRRKAFIRKWRRKHRTAADSLDETGAGSSPSLVTDEIDKHFLSVNLLCAAWAPRSEARRIG
jgi:hypothetical protein